MRRLAPTQKEQHLITIKEKSKKSSIIPIRLGTFLHTHSDNSNAKNHKGNFLNLLKGISINLTFFNQEITAVSHSILIKRSKDMRGIKKKVISFELEGLKFFEEDLVFLNFILQ